MSSTSSNPRPAARPTTAKSAGPILDPVNTRPFVKRKRRSSGTSFVNSSIGTKSVTDEIGDRLLIT
jgi:hypothetical protein